MTSPIVKYEMLTKKFEGENMKEELIKDEEGVWYTIPEIVGRYIDLQIIESINDDEFCLYPDMTDEQKVRAEKLYEKTRDKIYKLMGDLRRLKRY